MSVRNPELSTATIMKPFSGFESKFQGAPVLSNPIAIPGGLDFLAGQPGYDPNLLAGVPVPIGGDALIYFPRILPVYGSTTPLYMYTVVWRMRSQAEQTRDAGLLLAGNLGQRLQGVPESSTGSTSQGPRFVIPAAVDSITYVQDEPTNPTSAGVNHVRSAQEQLFGGEWQAPLSPNFPNGGGGTPANKLNAAGIVSQGLYPDTDISGVGPDYGRAGWRGGPNYLPIMRKIKGNELIILVSREPGSDANWDFGGADSAFSEFFGTDNGARAPIPNTGIQLYTGSFT